MWTKIYPPTQASTVTSTDCLYLCDACTLRVVHIILHTPPSPQTRLWDVFQRWCHAPPNQDAWWWGRWAWATAPTVWRLTFFPGSTRMPPQLPHPCMPPVAAMLLFCTAHLPVTCPVPPTACHMPCDPIPRSFSTLGVWAHNLCEPKSTHPHRRAQGAHHLTHSPQPTDPTVGCLPKMMPCSPQPRCLMMRPLGLSHRTNCLAPHLLSWINPHAATAATPLHAAGSCHASLLHRPPACHMPLCRPRLVTCPATQSLDPFQRLAFGLITCVNQNLPTHTGEHSHFNRLPLPMWRVHLKGCAHHLTHRKCIGNGVGVFLRRPLGPRLGGFWCAYVSPYFSGSDSVPGLIPISSRSRPDQSGAPFWLVGGRVWMSRDLGTS